MGGVIGAIGSAANWIGNGVVQGATAVGNGVVGAENWVNHNVFHVGDVGDPKTADIRFGIGYSSQTAPDGSTVGFHPGMADPYPVGSPQPQANVTPQVNNAVASATNNYLNSNPPPYMTAADVFGPNTQVFTADAIPPSNHLGLTPIQIAQPQTAPPPSLGMTQIQPTSPTLTTPQATSVGTTPANVISFSKDYPNMSYTTAQALYDQKRAAVKAQFDARLAGVPEGQQRHDLMTQYGNQVQALGPAPNQSDWHAPQTAPASAAAPTTPAGSGSDIPGWVAPAVAAGGALVGAGGALAAGNAEANAATEAARIQAAAATHAADLQKTEFDQQRTDALPWMDAGKAALGKLGTFDADHPAFGTAQFQADPGYSFRLSEGLKALQNSAAARGGLLSGNTMKGIQGYGQEQASQEYSNAFNRYQTERGQRLNSLQSLAGVGQTATQQVGQAGQNYATNAGNALIGGANATAGGITGAAGANASGYMGAGNALNNALSSYLNYSQSQSLLNSLTGRK